MPAKLILTKVAIPRIDINKGGHSKRLSSKIDFVEADARHYK